ncbi:leucine-rich repeat-containing protein 9 [Xenentodon cancila]
MSNEKQQNPTDEDVIKKLCLVNGVSYEEIVHEGGNVRSLEIFFSGFPRMVGLSFFPSLCQLTIVDQSIKNTEGLESCPLLQELWIVQCNLTEISGLQNCKKLEKLYLYDNQIYEIKNLELQVNLEVLWLNNNRITKIQGLDTLLKVKELNLADNTIEKIGHNLDPNVNLEILNLSGNKISSFKELAQLAHLPHLRELALQEPMSTPNPVCLLPNYATHIIYHMPGLQRLDIYDVSEKQVKEAAESAVMKKLMYYNMRVRTAKRNLTDTQLSLTGRKKTLLRFPEECIRTLSDALKRLEHELSMVPLGCEKSVCMLEDKPEGVTHQEDRLTGETDTTTDTDITSDPDMVHKIHHKMEVLKERLKLWTRRMDDIEAWYERELAQATNMMQYMVQFLVMELESVGNIRLEEGCSTDPWFTSCSDLLLSRFAPSDYQSHSIINIKVNRVFRIHNSALRLRFEDKLHSLLSSEDSITFLQNYRRRLEYLFYIPDPEKCEKDETLHILEEGFKTSKHQKASGREVGVPLSNSLGVTEQPRIDYVLHQASQAESKQSMNVLPFKHGHVLVSKVFVGKSMPIRDGIQVDRSKYPGLCSVFRNIDAKCQSTLSDEKPCSNKTLAGSDCSPRLKQWFVFEHELVLPEYIIYFEYIIEDKDQTELPAYRTDGDATPSYDMLDKAVLNMEPILKPKPKLLGLNDEILLNMARANILSQITVLNLHGNSLRKIKEISSLTALKHLTISFNEFTYLDDISYMPNLQFLDASFNHVGTLEGLRGLRRLKELNVCWNKLTKAREDMSVLRKHTPALLKLDTQYNPWDRPEEVRMTILGGLTTLTHLDGVLVREEAEAVQIAAASKINQASLLAHSRTNSNHPRSLSLLSTAQLIYRLSPTPWGPGRELEPDWTLKITTLNLDNQRISRLINLSKLENLRWASFNDNNICNVEGIDSCLKLEELSLNNNNIRSIKGLARLHHLHKLSLDGNRLSSLDASVLGQLHNLIFLSVENNCISSMHGIQKVQSLLELFIGYNQISTSGDVFCLKGLASLIILDLCGNPLVEKLENYRIYVVFHLPSLKVLDGIVVEVSECESAKNMFRGRLTTDTLAEKLGHSNYTEIINLTLQSCSIRMVDLSPIELFCNLRSVNLDHNNLTCFSSLINLPSIKILSLNYNYIKSILPNPKTQCHLTKRQMLHSKVQSSGYGQQSQIRANRDTGPTGSLEPLMGSLEVLHMSHNGISNMANLQLSRLTNLKTLVLQGNEISQVQGLDGLHQLRQLVLDRNRIKGLNKNSFTAQSVLVELHLAQNQIRDLNHLDPLFELRKLFLGTNKLQDIRELEKLEVLPSLTELSVSGNPVTQNSLYRPAVVRCLSQLQVLDGVLISQQTRAELLSADLSQSSQHPGASFPTTGLLPTLPHYTTPGGMSIVGGLQNSMLGHDTLPIDNS